MVPNNIICGRKRLDNNCSGVNKTDINKDVNSCNTLQKLRVNILLIIIVGQLNINSTRNTSGALCNILSKKQILTSKTDDIFLVAQLCPKG